MTILSRSKQQKVAKFLTQYIPYENIYKEEGKKVLSGLIYAWEYISLFIILLISWRNIPSTMDGETLLESCLVGGRILFCALYIVSKQKYKLHYLFIKVCGIVSLFLSRAWIFLLACFFEYICDVLYVLGKEQRKGNYDSRLTYQSYLCKLFILEMQVCVIIVTSFDEMNRNVVTFLFLNILYLICVYTDELYVLWTHNFLKAVMNLIMLINVCFFLLELYFDFQDVPIVLEIYVYILGVGIFLYCFWSGQFEHLQLNFVKKSFDWLNYEEKYHFVWEAIYLLGHKKSKKIIKEILTEYENIQKRGQELKELMREPPEEQLKLFPKYIERIIKKYSHTSETFNLLYLFYQDKPNQILFKSLKKEDFFEYRQFHRIRGDLIGKDIGAKMKAMEQSVAEINKLSHQMVLVLKQFLCYLNKDQMELDFCDSYAQLLYKTRMEMLEVGKLATGHENQRLLPKETLLLMNYLKKTILNEPFSDFIRIDDPFTSELINQQSPLIILSADDHSIGDIINCNIAACRQMCYSREELVGKHVSCFLREQIHERHAKYLRARSEKLEDTKRDLSLMAFVRKKTCYSKMCDLEIQFINGTFGKRWTVKMIELQHKELIPIIVINGQGYIVGMNEFIVNLGIDASFIQEYLGAEIVEKIAESKKIEIPIPSDSDVEAILGDEMIEFELLNVPSVLGDRGMPKFHILTMVTADIKKLTSRLKICKKDEGSPKLDKIDNHEKLGKTAREFQFHFNLTRECFTNALPDDQVHSQLMQSTMAIEEKMILVEKEEEGQQNCDTEELCEQNSTPKKQKKKQKKGQKEKELTFKHLIKDYTQNINEMIYFNGDIEFRENKKVHQVYQCDSHPSFPLRKEQPPKLPPLFQNKTSPKEIIENLETKIFGEIIIIIVMFIIFFLTIVAMVISAFILVHSSDELVQKKIETHLLMSERNHEYSKLGVNLLKPYFEGLGQWSQNDDEQFNGVIKSIQSLSTRISEIYSKQLSLQEKVYTLSTEFPQISKYSLEEILNHLLLLLEKLQDNETRLEAALVVSDAILPIHHSIAEDSDNLLDLDFIQLQDTALLIFYIVSGISLLCMFIILYQIKKIFEQHQKILSIFSTFPEMGLEYYEEVLDKLFISLGSERELSEISLLTNMTFEQRSFCYPRKAIYNYTPRLMNSIFVLFAFVTLLSASFSLVYFTLEEVYGINKLRTFSSLYQETLIDLDQYWLRICVDNWKNQLNISTYEYSEQIAMMRTLNLRKILFEAHFQDQLVLEKKQFYSEQLRNVLQKYQNKSPCDLFKVTCTPLNGYRMRNVPDSFVGKAKLIQELIPLPIHEKIHQNQELLHLLDLDSKLVESVGKETMKQFSRQFGYIEEELIQRVIFLLLYLTIICFVTAYRISTLKGFIIQPLKRILFLFPVFLLNQNRNLTKWYQEYFLSQIY